MKKIVLLVEDEELLRRAFTAILTVENFTVHQTSNGQEALDFLQSRGIIPDIIVLDLLMPIMGGLEFLKASNYKASFPDTKVLVLSNLSDEKTLKSIQDAGAENYLLKSGVSPKQLVAAVKALA